MDGEPTVLGNKDVKITLSEKRLSFVGEYGENVGTRDLSYKAPRGAARGRFVDFAWGDDCAFKIVADTAGFTGTARADVRVQCASDDEFRQDVFHCKSPQRVTLSPPPEPPPAPEQPEPGANAAKWSCTTTDGRVVSNRIEVTIDDDAVRLEADDLEYLGSRDRKYRSRSGSRIGYEDFGYGGDCEMTLVADANIVDPSARSSNLQVRCKGDDYLQDSYRCTAR
jgi:hypothetical protein